MDRLVKRYELKAVDAANVESPSIAVHVVEQALITPLNYFPGLLELIHECGATNRSCKERHYRDNILSEIKSGNWLLITRQPFLPWNLERRPFPGGYSGHAVAPAPAAAPTSEERLRREPPPKLRIALRLGVFFDGTHNNATNAAQGLLCGAQHAIAEEDLDASCKPYMGDPESSYGNGVTNIKLLHDLYPETRKIPANSEARLAHRRVYIEGIGTRTGEEDSLFGAGTGRGDTGVEAKVRQAFRDIRRTCHNFVNENPDYEIDSLTLDIFGFSRGAAAARHFANELLRGPRGLLSEVLRGQGGTFTPSMTGRYGRGVRVAFIGLFDTVASTAGLANLGNVRSAGTPLQLYLPPAYFPTVVHLVARDEYRANFALNSTAPEHRELVLPGAHADLGGGYLAEAEECLLVSPMQALDVPHHTQVANTSIHRDAEQVRDAWLARGWSPAMLEIVTPAALPLPPDPTDRLAPPRKRVYAALQLKRPVRGELSRVYLQLMHQLAWQNGVNFDDIPDRSDTQLPMELRPLCDRFLAGDFSMSPSEERLLQLHYIHCSAHWNPPARLQGQTPRTGIALTFINAPTADGRRVHHPHTPDRS